MSTSFLEMHSSTSALLLAAVLAVSGYIRFRADRGASIAGVSSWIIALVILVLALSGLPASGAIGVVFVIVAVALGIVGIVHMINKARNEVK